MIEQSTDSGAVKSAHRLLQILDALMASPNGATASELGRLLGLPKSSGHALLKTMTTAGYLEQDPLTREYTIGLRCWEVGQAYRRGVNVAATVRPALMSARDELLETVQLAALDGSDVVYIDKVEGPHLLALVSRIGARLPAAATSLGKVLLADLSPDEVAARLADYEFVPYTSKSVRSFAAFTAELDAARSDGYATDDGEYTVGVCCVACPIYDQTGTARAAMSVSVPEVRITNQVHLRLVKVLKQRGREATRLLGGTPRT